ncbi:MAG: metal-dependent hydrolase [Verrucomicrobia bacterium]|nr:metal-dependent hydrolase [Verrucomicrobiota bacterium]
MTPVFHALAPASAAYPFLRKDSHRLLLLQGGVIALAGVLPDLLDPHTTLQARHVSFTHTLAAWAGFSALLILPAWKFAKTLPPSFWCIVSLSYLSHIFLDAISGGVQCLRPISSVLVGGPYVPFRYWLWCDVAALVTAYTLYRWLPVFRKRLSGKPQLR